MRPRRGEPGYVRQVRRTPVEYPGTRYISTRKQWRAKIKVNQVNYVIGFYDTAIEAAEAYQAAKEALLSGIDITQWGLSNVLR